MSVYANAKGTRRVARTHTNDKQCCCAWNIVINSALALCGDMIILWVAINEFQVKAILINVIKFGVYVCVRECFEWCASVTITKAHTGLVLDNRVLILCMHLSLRKCGARGNGFDSTKVFAFRNFRCRHLRCFSFVLCTLLSLTNDA